MLAERQCERMGVLLDHQGDVRLTETSARAAQ